MAWQTSFEKRKTKGFLDVFWSTFKPRHERAAVIFFGISSVCVLLALLDVAVPWLMRDALLDLTSSEISKIGILSTLALLGFSHLAKAVVLSLKTWLAHFYESNWSEKIRLELAEATCTLSGGIDGESAGQLIGGLSADLQTSGMFLRSTLWESITQALFFACSGAVLFYLNPTLAFISLVPIPLAFGIQCWLLPRLRIALSAQHLKNKELSGQFQEIFEGQSIIATCGAKDSVLARFSLFNSAVLRSSRNWARLSAFQAPIYEGIGGLCMVLLLFTGAGLLRAGKVTPDTILSFVVFLGYFYRPIFAGSRLRDEWLRSHEAVFRLKDLIEKKPSTQADADSISQNILFRPFSSADQNRSVGCDIKLDSLTFEYKNNKPVFERFSIAVPGGARVAVMGPNGVGKSTLLKILTGILRAHSGVAIFSGSPRLLDPNEFSYLPQEPFLFNSSILENILLTCPGISIRQIETMARRIGVHESFLACPEGYNTIVGSRGTSISGGQRQRISLLRFALRAQNATYCFLDEPGSYIDLVSERALIRSVLDVCEGKTTMIVTHRKETLALCDFILDIGHEKSVLRSCVAKKSQSVATTDVIFAGEFSWQN